MYYGYLHSLGQESREAYCCNAFYSRGLFYPAEALQVFLGRRQAGMVQQPGNPPDILVLPVFLNGEIMPEVMARITCFQPALLKQSFYVGV